MNSFKNKREEGNLTFTGFRPTGRIHLGNLSTLLELISDKEVLFMIADLHGMVSGYGSQKKGNLMVRTIVGIFEFYNKSNWNIYYQSQNPYHLELFWKLSTLVPTNILKTMVSYKSAQDKNLSLLCYPILMAADIMIHNVTQVPVGEDQRQHLELYEKLRNKVNRRLEDKKVDLYIRRLDMKRIKHRIMDLVNPKIKMSKSNMNESGIIYIDDDPLIIRNKIRQGLSSSDPLSKDHRDESIKNLLTIALLFWPEGYVYLSNLTGKKHFLFKAMLGLGISFKISRLWGFISKVSTGKIDDYCNKGLRRSRELSEPVLLKLNLLWN